MNVASEPVAVSLPASWDRPSSSLQNEDLDCPQELKRLTRRYRSGLDTERMQAVASLIASSERRHLTAATRMIRNTSATHSRRRLRGEGHRRCNETRLDDEASCLPEYDNGSAGPPFRVR